MKLEILNQFLICFGSLYATRAVSISNSTTFTPTTEISYDDLFELSVSTTDETGTTVNVTESTTADTQVVNTALITVVSIVLAIFVVMVIISIVCRFQRNNSSVKTPQKQPPSPKLSTIKRLNSPANDHHGKEQAGEGGNSEVRQQGHDKIKEDCDKLEKSRENSKKVEDETDGEVEEFELSSSQWSDEDDEGDRTADALIITLDDFKIESAVL